MTIELFTYLQNLWPFSVFYFDDLRASDQIISKLSIPDSTKAFVFAIRDPKSESVIYILAAQNLSGHSAIDSECLIRQVRPDAVVVQVGNSSIAEIQSQHDEMCSTVDVPVPTSSFEVLKRCFIHKVNREKYESLAGNLVLRDIFGVGFYGHVLSAKRAAKDVDATFLVIEAPFLAPPLDTYTPREAHTGSLQGLVSSFIPQRTSSMVSSNSKDLFLKVDGNKRMLMALSSNINASMPELNSSSEKEVKLDNTFQVPSFAMAIYPLLVDLHDIFSDLPFIQRALACSQRILHGVNNGEVVDGSLLYEVYTFRLAVEGLRIALNSEGRVRMDSSRKPIDFSDLPLEERSHALLAQALRSQNEKFKTLVAVVDASCLAGLRRHWRTAVSMDVKEFSEKLVSETEEDISAYPYKQWLFSTKPMVAVGAGATAVLGASSLSKTLPASTFLKIISLKVPTSFKLMFIQTHKAVTMAFSKGFTPSKVYKAAASAEKIRTVTQGIIASGQKTSFSAMRTAFYEIMRRRHVQPVGALPWAAFSCSIVTFSGLLLCGDGIECAAESIPSAPAIASLGRGVRRLQSVSNEISQTVGAKLDKSIETLMYRLKKVDQ